MLKVSELLSDPARHCKFAYGKDKLNRAVDPDDESAVQWCLVGAIYRCYQMEDRDAVFMRLVRAIEALHPELPVGRRRAHIFNDHTATTHAQIMEVVELAGV